MNGVRSTPSPLDQLAEACLLTNRAEAEDDRSWHQRNRALCQAGHRFAQLHRQLEGSMARAGASVTMDRRSTLDQFAAARYHQSRNALALASQGVLQTVQDVVVKRQPLPDEGTHPGRYKTQLLNLRRGLSILEDLPPPSEHGA